MRNSFGDLQGLGTELQQRLGDGCRFIWRGQSSLSRRAAVRDGIIEDVGEVRSAGQGLQLYAANGASVLVSHDDLQPQTIEALALEGGKLLAAATAPAVHLEPVGFEPCIAEAWPEAVEAIERADPMRAAAALQAHDEKWRALYPRLRFRWSCRSAIDAWKIVREDGTDVVFAQPRFLVSVQIRADVAQPTTINESKFSLDPGLLENDKAMLPLEKRLHAACAMAQSLPDAPNHPAGPTALVIDYGLAKGLAHEAFGHASEADGFRSSVLAKDGRFQVGRRVGAERISIIDEPQQGDHAWQPYSHNGLPRQAVRVVDRGLLSEALSDPWSATASGVMPMGSSRAESYGDAPLPRMTNIRLEIDDALPAGGDFEDYDAARVHDLLADAGIFKRHKRISWLCGYRGGQVNPSSGDFVFNCRAIWTLGEGAPTLHKPAIFSGSMFGALESIGEAFGPLRLDALGYCGKWGQSVPSSGGGPFFVVIDDDERLRLGGVG
jgi:TldD protein